MAHLFPSRRQTSAGQLFRESNAARSTRPRYDYADHSQYDDHPTNVPGAPRGVIPGRRASDQSSESGQSPPPNPANRPPRSRAAPTRTRPDELVVQVFDGSTTATQLMHGRFEYQKVPVKGRTTVRGLIEKLGGGPGFKILAFRKDYDGEFEQEISICYGKDDEREFWTMEMFGWAKHRGSAEENGVLLVLDKYE